MPLKEGEYIKVWLPGEAPWVLVLAVGDGIFKGRISNKLFREYSVNEQREFTGENFGTAAPLPELHKYKQGDELWFERGDLGMWVPLAGHG